LAASNNKENANEKHNGVHGVIDEVRISDVALKPKEFLAVSR